MNFQRGYNRQRNIAWRGYVSGSGNNDTTEDTCGLIEELVGVTNDRDSDVDKVVGVSDIEETDAI